MRISDWSSDVCSSDLYAPAEASADKYHGVAKFDVVTGVQAKAAAKAPSYTKVFGESLIAEAERDERIVAITGAMPGGTGVDMFAKRFPDRAFAVGLAEQHAVTFPAGLPAEGYRSTAARRCGKAGGSTGGTSW